MHEEYQEGSRTTAANPPQWSKRLLTIGVTRCQLQVGAGEFKTKCLKLLDEVANSRQPLILPSMARLGNRCKLGSYSPIRIGFYTDGSSGANLRSVKILPLADGTCTFTRSRSSLPGLKCGTALAGTRTIAPVLGFRPHLGGRRFTEKVPKPRISALSPCMSTVEMASRIALTDSDASGTVNSGNRDARRLINCERVIIGIIALTNATIAKVRAVKLYSALEVFNQRAKRFCETFPILGITASRNERCPVRVAR
jgi:hypothetical protein